MTPLESISALIRHRRTIKPANMATNRPVERDLLMTLLENATWAPTHGVTEPWRFKIYEGSTRQELAQAMQKIYREVTPPEEFREDKLVKMSENPLLAPTVIVAWMERSVGHKVPALEEIEAVACALQNVMLTASSVELGSFWSSPPLIESQAFKQWLGIRAEDRCLGLLYLGWPKAGFEWPHSARKPLHNCVSWA